MSAAPVVSVIMPAFNAARFLREAVQSILGQTESDLELIVVDDGSTDRTSDILDEIHDERLVRLRHGSNRGIVAALNHAQEAARGEFIARLDADDVARPDRLAAQVAAFRKDARLVIAGSDYRLIDEQGAELSEVRLPREDTVIRWRLLFQTPFGSSSVMYRAQVAREHGLAFNPAIPLAEDYDFWCTLLRCGTGRNLPVPLVSYRVYASQTSALNHQRLETYATAISGDNMRKLGVNLGDGEVRRMRAWFEKLPQPLGVPEMALCSVFFRLLTALERDPYVDAATLCELKSSVVTRLLRHISVSRWPAAARAGLLGAMARAGLRPMARGVAVLITSRLREQASWLRRKLPV